MAIASSPRPRYLAGLVGGMEGGITPVELIFVLFALAIGLSYLARRLHIAEPILLLLGGYGTTA